MKQFVNKIKNFWIWLWKQLKDWRNFVIFIIVVMVVSCEVWIPYIFALITKNAWWWTIGSACWAFWLAPFTPFIPLCIAITFGIRKLLNKIKERKK